MSHGGGLVDGAALTQTVIANTGSEQRSAWSLGIGTFLTLIGASTVFGQLQYALNRVWRVKAAPRAAIATVDVNAVTLFQSRLSQAGPAYTRLAAARLVCP